MTHGGDSNAAGAAPARRPGQPRHPVLRLHPGPQDPLQGGDNLTKAVSLYTISVVKPCPGRLVDFHLSRACRVSAHRHTDKKTHASRELKLRSTFGHFLKTTRVCNIELKLYRDSSLVQQTVSPVELCDPNDLQVLRLGIAKKYRDGKSETCSSGGPYCFPL